VSIPPLEHIQGRIREGMACLAAATERGDHAGQMVCRMSLKKLRADAAALIGQQKGGAA